MWGMPKCRMHCKQLLVRIDGRQADFSLESNFARVSNDVFLEKKTQYEVCGKQGDPKVTPYSKI